MNKIDEILGKILHEFKFDTPEGATPKSYDVAKAELLQLVLDVIGSDEPEDLEYEYYNKFHNNRNRLRAKQRNQAKELFGDDK